MFKEFPRWMYHVDGRSCIVKSQEEADALGEGWTRDLAELKAMREKAADVEAESEAEPDPAPAPAPAKPVKPVKTRKR